MLDDEEVGSVAEDTSTTDAEEVENDQPDVEDEVSGEAEEANDESDEDSDGDQPDTEEGEEVAETVKVEFDGEEYEVPTKIKDAIMRDQDYTHKTQSLAEERRAFEAAQADFQQYSEASTAHASQMAELAAIDRQLKAFNDYDWNAAFDADITAATKLRHQADQLGQARQQVIQNIQEAETTRDRLYYENLSRTAERTDKQLKSEIPNWGDELKAELGKFAVETMGFPAEAVAKAVTPQEIKALYYAQVGFKALNKVKAESAKAKAPVKATAPSKVIKQKRQTAPADLSKISDPAKYREMRLARRRKQG